MRSVDDHRREFSDFTEAGYRELIRLAKANYRFRPFDTALDSRTILWRHDLDVSLQRALKLAEIEHEEGVLATYFLFPRSIYYNILTSDAAAIVRRIVELGHDLALHFDPTHYGPKLDRSDLLAAIAAERDLIEAEFRVRPKAVSFHLYGVLEDPMPEDDTLAGLVNAYSDRLRRTCGYVSDSNGVWLYRRLRDVLAEATEDHLQVLTHPEWWTPDVMPPRARLQRAIDGYARAMGEWYDDIVARSKRPNLR